MLKSKQEVMRDVGKVLRHIIEIEKKTVSEDDIGNQLETWNQWGIFWVEANGLYGTEYYAASSVNEENTVEISLKYCIDLDDLNTIEYRVIFKNKTYDIKNIDHVKYQNNWVKLKLMERGINGS